MGVAGEPTFLARVWVSTSATILYPNVKEELKFGVNK